MPTLNTMDCTEYEYIYSDDESKPPRMDEKPTVEGEYYTGVMPANKTEGIYNMGAVKKFLKECIGSYEEYENARKGNKMDELKLGTMVYDIITGFKGRIVGIADFLYNEKEFLVQPESKDDTTMADSCWFTRGRLRVFDGEKMLFGE